MLPLDRSHNIYLTELMLEYGATVCTAVAFSNVVSWGYLRSWGKGEYDIEGILLKLLSRVGAFDPTNGHVISGLCRSIRAGHERTAIWLLEKGVKVPSKVHPQLLATPPLCVARPINRNSDKPTSHFPLTTVSLPRAKTTLTFARPCWRVAQTWMRYIYTKRRSSTR